MDETEDTTGGGLHGANAIETAVPTSQVSSATNVTNMSQGSVQVGKLPAEASYVPSESQSGQAGCTTQSSPALLGPVQVADPAQQIQGQRNSQGTVFGNQTTGPQSFAYHSDRSDQPSGPPVAPSVLHGEMHPATFDAPAMGVVSESLADPKMQTVVPAGHVGQKDQHDSPSTATPRQFFSHSDQLGVAQSPSSHPGLPAELHAPAGHAWEEKSTAVHPPTAEHPSPLGQVDQQQMFQMLQALQQADPRMKQTVLQFLQMDVSHTSVSGSGPPLSASSLLVASTNKAESPIADIALSVGSRPGQVTRTPGSASSSQGSVEGTQGMPAGTGHNKGLIDQRFQPVDRGVDSQKSSSCNTSLVGVNSTGDVDRPLQHSDSAEHQRPASLKKENLNQEGAHRSEVGGHQGLSQETGRKLNSDGAARGIQRTGLQSDKPGSSLPSSSGACDARIQDTPTDNRSGETSSSNKEPVSPGDRPDSSESLQSLDEANRLSSSVTGQGCTVTRSENETGRPDNSSRHAAEAVGRSTNTQRNPPSSRLPRESSGSGQAEEPSAGRPGDSIKKNKTDLEQHGHRQGERKSSFSSAMESTFVHPADSRSSDDLGKFGDGYSHHSNDGQWQTAMSRSHRRSSGTSGACSSHDRRDCQNVSEVVFHVANLQMATDGNVFVYVKTDENVHSHIMLRVGSSRHWMSSSIQLPVNTRTPVTYQYGLSVPAPGTWRSLWMSRNKVAHVEKVIRPLEERCHQWNVHSFEGGSRVVSKYDTVHCYLHYLCDNTKKATLKELMDEISHILKKLKLERDDSIRLARTSVGMIRLSNTGSQRLLLLFAIGLCVKDRGLTLLGNTSGIGLALTQLYNLERFTTDDILSEARPVIQFLTNRMIREQKKGSEWIPVLKSFLVLDPGLGFAEVVECTNIDQGMLGNVIEFTAEKLVDKVSHSQYMKLCKLLMRCTSSLHCVSGILNLCRPPGQGHHFWLDDYTHGEVRSLFNRIIERVLKSTSDIEKFWNRNVHHVATNVQWLVTLVRDSILTLLQKGLLATEEDCRALLSLCKDLKLFTIENLCVQKESVLRKVVRSTDQSVQRIVFLGVVSHCLTTTNDQRVYKSVCQLCEEWLSLSSSRPTSDAHRLTSFLDAYSKMSERVSQPSQFEQHIKSFVLKRIISFSPQAFFKSAASGRVTSKIEGLFLDAAQQAIQNGMTMQEMVILTKPLVETGTPGSSNLLTYDLSSRVSKRLIDIAVDRLKDEFTAENLMDRLRLETLVRLLYAKRTSLRSNESPWFQKAVDSAVRLYQRIVQGRMTIKQIRQLLLDKQVVNHLAMAVECSRTLGVKQQLATKELLCIDERIQTFENQLSAMDKFQVEIVSKFEAEDAEELAEALQLLDDAYANVAFADFEVSSQWKKVAPLDEGSGLVSGCLPSRCFRGILSNTCERWKLSEGSACSLTAEILVEQILPSSKQAFHDSVQPLFSTQKFLLQRVQEAEIVLDFLSCPSDVHPELGIFECQFDGKIPKEVKELLFSYIESRREVEFAKLLLHSLGTFRVDMSHMVVDGLKRFLDTNQNREQLTVQEFNKQFDIYKRLRPKLEPDRVEILKSLEDGVELVSFFFETRENEETDLTKLVDAVEEHSDSSLVTTVTIKSLLHTEKVLRHLTSPHLTVDSFVERMDKVYSRTDESVATIVDNINSCKGHSVAIRQIYNSLKDRREVTKQIIRDAAKNGIVTFNLTESGDCMVTLQYSMKSAAGDKTLAKLTKSLEDMRDLQCRAHLIVNSERMRTDDDRDVQDSILCKIFIEEVDLVERIATLCTDLFASGHLHYGGPHSFTLDGLDELRQCSVELQQQLDEWHRLLSKARRSFYYLNYFHSDQIRVLHKYLTEESTEDMTRRAENLLKFVNSSLPFPVDVPFVAGESLPTDLERMGIALDEMFEEVDPLERSISEDVYFPQHVGDRVGLGELVVAHVSEDKLCRCLLSLFLQSQGCYPEPHQLLVCHSNTTWVQVENILWRCFYVPDGFHQNQLFCLANADHLPSDVQHKLMDFFFHILENQGTPLGISGFSNSEYKIAVVCSRPEPQHILDNLQKYRRNLTGLSKADSERILDTVCHSTVVVTSSQAGQGKTEFIKQDCFTNDKVVRTVAVEGLIDHDRLTKCLYDLNLEDCHALHIDIADVDCPDLLDNWIFELLVVGGVSSEDLFVQLPHRTVYIEIAKSLANNLENRLHFCQLLRSRRLTWDMNQLVVSADVRSPIQIVCNYLDHDSKGSLNSVDISFRPQQNCKTLPASTCRALLKQHFPDDDLTYNILRTFLNVLAQQLVRFSTSNFFQTETLKDTVGTTEIRSQLFRSFLEVSKEFAKRSVGSSRKGQMAAFEVRAGNVAEQAVERFHGMREWKHSNHLVVSFHERDQENVSALYLHRKDLRQEVEHVLKTQGGRDWTAEDLSNKSHKELVMKLERVFRKSPASAEYPNYALTRDNLLKAVMIMLRIQAHVPVIVMGETGCGKTSLVHFLATAVEAKLFAKNFHAGIGMTEILNFIGLVVGQAEKDRTTPVWALLDEINTCNHLGLLSDIVVHRTVCGRPLPTNIVFLAACNPYRFQQKPEATSGLSLALKGGVDTGTYRLVYLVNPLPECMVDYVWDYGALTAEEEIHYIEKILGDLEQQDCPTAALIQTSQEFVRNKFGRSGCSLRDVKRCRDLIEWFTDCCLNFKKHGITTISGMTKAVYATVLGLSVCYLCRLASTDLRNSYLDAVLNCFSSSKCKLTRQQFNDVLIGEERAYLRQMVLPKGIAANGALLENVFVLTVCILKRMPVFLVGKPGCSKSLSMQIIRSNLRGGDSPKQFFKKKPQTIVVSYQGSESSTSEGIIKIFDKAETLVDNGVIPVVLLDEVGLAELSKSNPLKVLHSRLEPHTKDGLIDGTKEQKLNVGVVGISNWELDASKMNRAVHLSRPEPDLDDLVKTGKEISRELTGDSAACPAQDIRQLAQGYMNYMKRQVFLNFHGLRDYYYLVKQISMAYAGSLNSGDRTSRKFKAVCRNFGGLEMTSEVDPCHIIAQGWQVSGSFERPTALELIKDNLQDMTARHLLLITNGDSAIDLLEHALDGTGFEPVVIYGSKFDNDIDEQSEQYNYRILSRIILYMETGQTLILKDLENIYGSLYDLLNQSYTEVMGKKNCRIAHGPYSSPLCAVHDNFRCIVLQDKADVTRADPPFLNRFEKQLLRFDDVVTEYQANIVRKVKEYLAMSVNPRDTVHFDSESTLEFNLRDAVVGMHCDLLPSLVYKLSSADADTNVSSYNLVTEEIIVDHLQSLLQISTMDYVMRLPMSELGEKHVDLVNQLQAQYFGMPHHRGLSVCIVNVPPGESLKAMVMTYSNIHTNIESIVYPLKPLVVRLSTVKSEEQFLEVIKPFWTSTADLLVVQCMPGEDSDHVLYAKFTLDQLRKERACVSDGDINPVRHICIIMHVDRVEKCSQDHNDGLEAVCSRRPEKWQFNFLCGWDLFFIDQLEEPEFHVDTALSKSIPELYAENLVDARKIARENLSWCLWCIRWPKSCTAKEIQQIQNRMLSSKVVMEKIDSFVRGYLKSENASGDGEWLVKLAFNKQQLVLHRSLQKAAAVHVVEQFRNPMAKLLYVMLRESILDTILSAEDISVDNPTAVETLEVIDNLMDKMVNSELSKLPNPSGMECFLLSHMPLCLKFPFSFVLYGRMRDLMYSFSEEDMSDDAEGPPQGAQEVQRTVFSEIMITWDRPVWQHYEEDFYSISSHELGVSPSSLRWVFRKMLTPADEDREGTNEQTSQFLQPADLHWLLEHQEITIRGLAALSTAVENLCSAELLDECSTGVELFPSEMVDMVCTKLVAMDEAVSVCCGNLQNWDRLAKFAISVIYGMTISVPSSAFAVGILTEFVSAVAIPFHLPDDVVFQLANVTHSALPDELNSEYYIEQLHQIVTNSHALASNPEATLAASDFLNNALDRLLDETNYDVILSLVATFRPSPGTTSVLRRFLAMSVDADEDLDLNRLLTKDAANMVKQNPFLEVLDSSITSSSRIDISATEAALETESQAQGNMGEKGCTHRLDNLFAVLCCNVVQYVFHSSLMQNDDLEEIAKQLELAGGIIANPVPTLPFVNAVAWIRTLLERCGQRLADEIENPDIGNGSLVELTNRLLEQSDELCLREEMRHLLLRHARRRIPLNTLASKLSQDSRIVDAYPWTQQIDLKDTPFDEPCGVNPFGSLQKYWEVNEAMKTACVRGGREEFKAMLDEASDSVDLFRSIVSNVACYLTLRGGKSQLGTEISSFIEWLEDPQTITNQLLSVLAKSLLSPVPSAPFHSERLVSQRNVQMSSVMLRLLVSLVPEPVKQLPFRLYLTDLKAAAEQFVITCYHDGSRTDTNTLDLGAVGDSGEDSCGCQYSALSSTLGFTPYSIKCPLEACGKNLPDDSSQVFTDKFPSSNTIVYATGYSQRTSWHHGNFQLDSPVSFLFLRSLLHMTIMNSLSTGVSDIADVTRFVFGAGKDIPQMATMRYLDSQMQGDWTALRTVLVLSDEQLAVLFHSVIHKLETSNAIELHVSLLNTPNARDRWERLFAQEVQPLLQNVKRTVKEHRQFLNSFSEKFQVPAQEAVEETRSELVNTSGSLRCGQLFFRYCDRPSVDDIYAALAANDSLRRRHAFLWLAISLSPYLKLVKLLKPLLSWINEVAKVSSFQLSRRESVSMLPEKFIKRFYEHKNDQDNIRSTLSGFCDAWRQVAALELKPTESVFLDPKLSDINPAQKISYSCLEVAGQGAYLFTILSFLVDIQNSFLAQVESLVESTPECTSLAHLRFNQSSPGHSFRPVVLQRCNPRVAADIVDYEWPPHLLNRSLVGLEYGQGDEVEYDFAFIEKNLVATLVTGKSVLVFDKGSMEPFSFAGELFRNFSRILKEVEEKTAYQVELTQELAETLKQSVDPSKYGKVLAALELLFCHLKRADNVQGEQTLRDYFRMWLKDHTPHALFVTDQIKKDVCVKHVISLYLVVEELQAEIVLPSLPTEYTKRLQDSSKRQIEKLGPQKSHFLNALRRFMFRNLMTPSESLEPAQPFLQCFDQLEWTKSFNDVSTVKSLLPEDILLENALDLYQLLKDLIEKERSSTISRAPKDRRRKPDKASRARLF